MRLKEDERKQAAADYMKCKNYNAVARKYGVSQATVRNAVKRYGEIYGRLPPENTEVTKSEGDTRSEIAKDEVGKSENPKGESIKEKREDAQSIKEESAEDEFSDMKAVESNASEKFADDVTNYMSGKQNAVCRIIDLYLDDLASKEKREKASLSQIASSLKIVIDKFTTPQNDAAVEEEDDEEGIVLIPEVISDE